MKPFIVELKVTAVVMAESDKDAYNVAHSKSAEIVGDELEVDVQGELTCLRHLPDGWEPDCVPYGGDGDTMLRDLVPEEEPTRDTKTIDMFEVQ